jgi:type II secretory pathway pseudopilin PulG
MNNKKNMKSGITLIEIILAIVLIAVIMGITIPKLMSNSAKAEMKTVITSDLKSIIDAANTWRKSSSTSNGNFQNINSAEIFSRLPSNMRVEGTKGLIHSSGLRTGLDDNLGAGTTGKGTGVTYTITWQFDSTTYPQSGNFSIGMSIKNGIEDLNWDSKLMTYAKDIFRDVIYETSDGNFNAHTSSITTTGSSGVAMACGTAASDAICLGNIRVN